MTIKKFKVKFIERYIIEVKKEAYIDALDEKEAYNKYQDEEYSKQPEIIEQDSFDKNTLVRETLVSIKEDKELEKIISDLCKKSLEIKWNKESKYKIGDNCPFCTKNIEDNKICLCGNCLCPKEICWSNARHGIITDLLNAYDSETLVKDIDFEDLEQVIKLFKKYIIE